MYYPTSAFFLIVSAPAIHGQQVSFNSIQEGAVFFGPGVALPSFRMPENLPYLYIPHSFLLAARRIEMPYGKVLFKSTIVRLNLF